LETDPSDPNTIYSFVDREPSPESPAVVIQIQRLRGLINPEMRLDASDCGIADGISTTIQEFTWNGLETDVIRQTLTLPIGVDYVVYGIQYPLSGEAVQLQVSGPVQQDQEIYELFTQVARDFENTRPLHEAGDLGVRKRPMEDRIQDFVTGITRLSLTAIAIFVIFRLVKRSFSKEESIG